MWHMHASAIYYAGMKQNQVVTDRGDRRGTKIAMRIPMRIMKGMKVFKNKHYTHTHTV